MKKVLSLMFAVVFVLCLNGMSFAQEEAVMAVPMDSQVQEAVEVESAIQIHGVSDCCGPVMPLGHRHCRPFQRRSCLPQYCNPCNPCPPQCDVPCAPFAPRRCFAPAPRPVCDFNPCQAPCGPYVGNDCFDHCGSSACGVPCRTPIRNFFSRLFAPRFAYGCGGSYGCDGFGYAGDCCGGGFGGHYGGGHVDFGPGQAHVAY